MSALKADHGLALTDLVAFAPCGCWFAVMVESLDFAENAERTVEFVRDTNRSDKHGRVRIERMDHSDFAALPRPDCEHDPKWGGMEPTHRRCPRCHNEVKLRQDGQLAAHRPHGYSCSGASA